MSDRKFRDEELEETLHICSHYAGNCSDFCPLRYDDECVQTMAKHALARINSQKAKIESLTKVLNELKMEAEMVYKQRDAQKNRADSIAKFARAEAIKKFAERLKPKLSYYDEVYVDTLVKEMTEETKL